MSHVFAGARLAKPRVPDDAVWLDAALADHVLHALLRVIAAERRRLRLVHAGVAVGGALGAAALEAACSAFIKQVSIDMD